MAKEPLISQFKEYEWIEASSSVPRHKQRLMIVLHGCGDSLKGFRSLKDELKLPEMNYLLLNAPRKYDGGYTWYAFEPNHERGILAVREKLTLLLGELNEQGWSPDQIFLYGLSQGCLVSIDFALFSGVKIAGVVGISGYVQFWKGWKKLLADEAFEIPLLITHGVFDKEIFLLDTREQVEKLKQAGLNVLFKEFNKGHETDAEFEAPFIRKWVKSQITQTAVREKVPSFADTLIRSLLGRRGRSRSAFDKAARR